MIAKVASGLLMMIVILGSCPSSSRAQPFASMLSAPDGDTTNFLRWVNNLNYPPSVEWRSPRLWLSPSFGQMTLPIGAKPLAGHDWRPEQFAVPDKDAKDESTDRQSSIEESDQGMEKRDNYLSMCHFKICNLGRKRRFSYFAAPAWPARYPSLVPSK